MNIVDITILALLGIFAGKGLWRGLLREICSLCGLIGGSALGFRYHAPLAEMLAESLQLPYQLCATVTFILLFLVVAALFAGIGYFLSKVLHVAFLGGVNRVVGGLFGLLQGVLLLAILLFALTLRPLPGGMGEAVTASHLSPPFVTLGETVFTGGRDLFAVKVPAVPHG